MSILKHLKTLQHVSIIIQIIFRELVGSSWKSPNLKVFKIVKVNCGDAAAWRLVCVRGILCGELCWTARQSAFLSLYTYIRFKAIFYVFHQTCINISVALASLNIMTKRQLLIVGIRRIISVNDGGTKKVLVSASVPMRLHFWNVSAYVHFWGEGELPKLWSVLTDRTIKQQGLITGLRFCLSYIFLYTK